MRQRTVSDATNRVVVGSKPVAAVVTRYVRFVARHLEGDRSIGVVRFVPHTVGFLADPTHLRVQCDLYYYPKRAFLHGMENVVVGVRIESRDPFDMDYKVLLVQKVSNGASAVDLPFEKTCDRSFRFANEAVRVPHTANVRLGRIAPGSIGICWCLLPTARVVLK